MREYGLLRDCIYEQMEEAAIAPTLRELRDLSDCISGAIADSINEYVRAREDGTEAERRHLIGLFEQAPGFVCFFRGPEFVFELVNPAYYQLVGHRDIIGRPVREALPEFAG